MFTDKRIPDLAALEGGAPLNDGVRLFWDIIKELPEAARRLFATPQGWAAILGISAAALGLTAVDFDHAQAMVGHNAPDHTNPLGGGFPCLDDENVCGYADSPPIRASGVAPGLGLSDVDVVTRIPLGKSRIVDDLLEKLAAQAKKSGIHLAVGGAYVVEMSDLRSIPRSSHTDNLIYMRGGVFPDGQTPSGFSPLVIDSRMIAFARVAETGQPVVALAQSENGDLTGLTELGDGKLFDLKYGPSGWDHTLGIEVEMNGSMVFQPLIDTRDGRILIPNGQVIDGVSQVAAEGGGGKPLAVLPEFAGYVSPTFEQLQSLVAESEKYTLTSYEDGLLYDGSPIPGLTVDRDGNIILTVGNEQVTLDPADVNFDDDGIDIDGYEWDEETGAWVEMESEAEQAAKADFAKYGYDYSELTLNETESGSVEAIDEEGNVVYSDGKYDFGYAVEQAGQLDLMSTNINYREDIFNSNGIYATDDDNIEFEYFGPLYKRVRAQFIQTYGFDPYEKGKSADETVMLNPEILAWGRRMMLDYKDLSAGTYLYYELADGTIHIVPLQ